jgi:hypothetical protein
MNRTPSLISMRPVTTVPAHTTPPTSPAHPTGQHAPTAPAEAPSIHHPPTRRSTPGNGNAARPSGYASSVLRNLAGRALGPLASATAWTENLRSLGGPLFGARNPAPAEEEGEAGISMTRFDSAESPDLEIPDPMPLTPPSPDTASSVHGMDEARSLGTTRATKSIASGDGAGSPSLSGSIHGPQERVPQAPPTRQEIAAAEKELADAHEAKDDYRIMIAQATLDEIDKRLAQAAGTGQPAPPDR